MTVKNGAFTKQLVAVLIPVALAMVVAIAVLTAQWQGAIDATTQLDKEVSQIFDTHKVDIARLDESNRNRRNQIADLEERIARVEERTKNG